ncbi:GGDEF domain-containing protein [Rhodococcus sp. IEGM 1318]|uniref:GGDEF domain-containing protein n=1 Tax=Rhodococcus sp. IEGM 1318 TaxID=3082226 RepID=UPI002952E60E|nr:GGDEF domain-containing protein [Rhodococcus sp. IEGM 1318]MDV8009543.1 GGDEF domain-containing protein [Rhodococcus sp. IEGM 1318]
MSAAGLYGWYMSFCVRTDARSLAVLVSTAGAIPLPAIALLSPSFVREGAPVYLLGVCATTSAIFLITLVVGKLSDRMFSVLGLVGMAGIALAAYLVTDPAAARGIVTLLSAIPAIAAMASTRRVILGHTIVAIALAWAVSIAVAESLASALVSCAVSVTVIWLPVFMIGTLRRSLEFSRARYRELANTDPLTGLPNRRGFLDRVERYARENPSGAEEVGFLVIDVDHFKQINDHFGHAAGDAVLNDVVAATLGAVRADVLVGRFGGEEFVAFFPASSLKAVFALSESIRISVAQCCNVTVSIGGIFCTVDDHGLTPSVTLSEFVDVLARRADTLMYAAKAAGRNTVRCEHLPPMSIDLLAPNHTAGAEPARFDITTPKSPH